MTTEPPSGQVRINLSRWAAIIGFLAAASALFGAYYLLPYRVEAVEKAHEKLEMKTEDRFRVTDAELRQQREILIRIDENVKDMRRAMRKE